MKENRLIVHVASEVAPFYKRGGLGDVVGALPLYLEDEHNHNVVISAYYDRKIKHLEGANLSSSSFLYQGVGYDFFSLHVRRKGIDYYFVKLSDSTVLSEIEASNGSRAYSNPVSIVPYFYFAKASLQLLADLHLVPDYIFCHDWHTAGLFGYPGLLKRFKNNWQTKTLAIIHNFEFRGDLYDDVFPFLEDEPVTQLKEIFDTYGNASMLSLALKNSDYIATVSHSYARELIHRRAPHTGLSHLDLCDRQVLSFLNGSDLSLWKPQGNPFLPVTYDSGNLENKKIIKRKVLEEYDFDDYDNIEPPLVLMLCRLTAQKGIELFVDKRGDGRLSIENVGKMLDRGIRFIVCGQPGGGIDGIIDKGLTELNKAFKGRFLYINKYGEKLAHKLLAASDILVAPSMFEPCGLIQIYAMSFGTVPVVRSVGGMKDTVNCYCEVPEESTGFFMKEFSQSALRESLGNAVDLYYNEPEEWQLLVRRGMSTDFSWSRMKDQYLSFFSSVEADPSITFERLSQAVEAASQLSVS